MENIFSLGRLPIFAETKNIDTGFRQGAIAEAENLENF